MFQGRWPTGMVACTARVWVLITMTLWSPPLETKTRCPSGCTTMPLLRRPTFTWPTIFQLAVSIL